MAESAIGNNDRSSLLTANEFALMEVYRRIRQSFRESGESRTSCRFGFGGLRRICCEGFARRGGLLEFLLRVPVPHGCYGKRHPLFAMLAAVVCATLCGFRGIRPVMHWLELHGVEMWHLLGFTRKPPVRQTFANVLAEVNPERMEQVLRELIEQLDLPDCSDDVAGTTVKPCA